LAPALEFRAPSEDAKTWDIASLGGPVSSRVVEIKLLGELEVLHGGRVQPLPASKKTRALLAYLVATAKPHSRERLCALLWDGPDDPRAALRWSLTKIRPLLDAGAQRLAADRERVSFEAAGAAVDAVGVRDDLRAGVDATPTDVLRVAAARFRGEFLEGLDLPSCYRFHEWCVGEREALRALRVQVLAQLGTRLDAEPEEALRFARERVLVDPLTEGSHLDLVRLLGRLGRVREAQAQYETCRRILETELGARTSQALEQARMELGRPATSVAAPPIRSPAAPSAADPPSEALPPPRPSTTLPLVGRADARQAIQTSLDAARADRVEQVLLFVGDPGIGKTRVLDELAERTQAAGGRVLRGRAFEAEMVRPYGAWIDALRSSKLGPLPAALAVDLQPLLPELSAENGGGAPPADARDRTRLFDAVSRLLATLATPRQPVALLLDDVQWLDEASAALLHFVARAEGLRHVVLGCAARSGELGDNAAVLRVVRTLERDRRLDQHHLGPLDVADTGALIRAAYPGVDGATIFAACDGHPLYALEIARALAAGGSPAPTTLDALIDERLAGLDEGARDLLPWAAALGRTFAPEVLADVTASSSSALLSALDGLERHGIVRPTGTTYDFAHDLLRQAAYRRLSEPRRRLVHLQIARVLQRTRAGDETISGEIAHHATLGGDAELAAAACVAAGERCLRLFAFGEAAELAKRGLQHVGRLDRQSRIQHHIALLAILVNSRRASRKFPQLGSELTRLVMEAQDTGMHAEAARGFFFLSMIHYVGEKFDDAESTLNRALDAARDADPLTAARQMVDSARCLLMLERDVPRAQAMIVEARAMLGPGGDQHAHVAWARGLLGHYCGDRVPALAALDEALEGYTRDQAHWETYQVMSMSVICQMETGDAAAGLERCAALREVAGKMSEGSEPVVAAALEALVRLALHHDGAEAACEGAIAALKAADAKAMLAYVLCWSAEHALSNGNLDVAERQAGDALTVAALVDRRSELAVARALLGLIALARHDRQSAEAHLRATREDRERPLGLSARALARLAALETALENLPVTTLPTRRRTTAPS
jgi:DNA-binding SARP family transcriptional activator/tetratricopeptide (TPR) repeat protein